MVFKNASTRAITSSEAPRSVAEHSHVNSYRTGRLEVGRTLLAPGRS